MARTLRDAKLDTRNSRLRLKARREPYWRSISGGLAVGYRRGAKGGTWIARHYSTDHGRRYQAIGATDDIADPDGQHVLSFARRRKRRARGLRTWRVVIAARRWSVHTRSASALTSMLLGLRLTLQGG
jgi:hypothetical protein